MAGLPLLTRWRSGRAAAERLHHDQAAFRSHVMLGAYGSDYFPHEPETAGELPESLVVALQVASEPWELSA